MNLNYHWALSLAFMVANNSNEKIDEVIWQMPIIQVFKIVSLVYSTKSGKDVPTHEDRKVIKRQQEKFKELHNANCG